MTDAALPADERWSTVQVSSFLGLTYQIARNNMLAGDYGPSEYDAKTRRLTVQSSKVRAMKSMRGARKGKRRQR